MQVNLLPWRVYAFERRKKIGMLGVFAMLFSAGLFFFMHHPYVMNATPIIYQSHQSHQIVKTTVAAPITIHSIPLQQLKWQGYIKQDQLVWALMMLPDQTVYAVTVGQVIGLEKATVLTISDQFMTVKVQNEKKQFYY